MKFYPNYKETENIVEQHTYIPPERFNYVRYVDGEFRKWCKANGLFYINAIASLETLVLDGILNLEQKDITFIHEKNAVCCVDKLYNDTTPSDILYNIYNKHNIPVSDYSNLEYMLNYRQELLNKLGSID